MVIWLTAMNNSICRRYFDFVHHLKYCVKYSTDNADLPPVIGYRYISYLAIAQCYSTFIHKSLGV